MLCWSLVWRLWVSCSFSLQIDLFLDGKKAYSLAILSHFRKKVVLFGQESTWIKECNIKYHERLIDRFYADKAIFVSDSRYRCSAGGLNPIRTILNELPKDTGMAFIIIRHVSRDSDQQSILSRFTQMPVITIQQGTIIKADCVYVNATNDFIGVSDNHFDITPAIKQRSHKNIDFLMTSVAKVADRFERDVKSWEGRRIRFHDLRHTAATLMLSKGIDVKTVSEILGHEDISTTMRYVHLLGKRIKQVSQTFAIRPEIHKKPNLRVVSNK